MNRAFRHPFVMIPVVAVLAVGLAVVGVWVEPAGAHGSTQTPSSRVFTCRFEQTDNPMCAEAWAAQAQALYDWMEVNIGDAAGRHRELIPDGQLCSAGRQKYAAFDRPGPWPVTALEPDADGLVDVVFESTAPHATQYYRVYLTGPGFDGRTDRLTWADLELVHDSGPLGAAPRNTLQMALPERAIPAVLYLVWQRSDSPEAFYACSDVTIGRRQGPAPSAPPGAPTSSAPAVTTVVPPLTTSTPPTSPAPTATTVVAPPRRTDEAAELPSGSTSSVAESPPGPAATSGSTLGDDRDEPPSSSATDPDTSDRPAIPPAAAIRVTLMPASSRVDAAAPTVPMPGPGVVAAQSRGAVVAVGGRRDAMLPWSLGGVGMMGLVVIGLGLRSRFRLR